MRAPLYEVKNRLSEYVRIAESGEPVEICKRGEPSVVIVRIGDYAPSGQKRESIFDKVHKRWLEENDGGIENEFVDEFVASLERERKRVKPQRPNPFADIE